MKLSVLIVLSILTVMTSAKTSLDLPNRKSVNSKLRSKISRDIFPYRSKQHTIKNMDTKVHPLNESRLGLIFSDVEDSPYVHNLSNLKLTSQIWNCLVSEDCFLSIYYVGYHKSVELVGREDFNMYVIYLLDQNGNIQEVYDGLSSRADHLSFDIGNFSPGSEDVPFIQYY